MDQALPQTNSRQANSRDVAFAELDVLAEQVRKYRDGKAGETKFQKQRLHFGTYAQRQEGVQMQRIKIPGGVLHSDQLTRLADAADRFGSGFMHFTTREDVQLYYVKLEEVPDLLRSLAEVGITTREACGNTVRNITACYRAGTSVSEPFDVAPYARALFEYLVRNTYNQNLGRKFKVTFEGCDEDHSGLQIHDIGLLARIQGEGAPARRGFKVWLGGGLGGAPMLGHHYTDFLPEEELFNLAASILRLFDRRGERKSRMKARMKFLIKEMGWDSFKQALDEERERVGPTPLLQEYLSEPETPASLSTPSASDGSVQPTAPDSRIEAPAFQQWARDSVIPHKVSGFKGVHVRLKLGDLISEPARRLADIARRLSCGELRVSIGQNMYLPWVRESDLAELYNSLNEAGLGEPGADTVTDITTCPGADTCRLGITSAKGLGSTISAAFKDELSEYRELARNLQIKISGCPNGCAQHAVSNIGFHAAALSHDGRTVPAYLIFLGGKNSFGESALGRVIGRYPTKNGVKVIEALLRLYRSEKKESEQFNDFVARMGPDSLKKQLEPFTKVPSYEDDPSFYQDWGHENETFAVRQGIKGECAGATVAEVVPTMDMAREWLAQGEAYFHHKEFEHAAGGAYEALAAAARVPLYQRLVDPFTSDQVLWEFENLFVLSGESNGDWTAFSSRIESMKKSEASEQSARELLDEARRFIEYSAQLAERQIQAKSSAATTP